MAEYKNGCLDVRASHSAKKATGLPPIRKATHPAKPTGLPKVGS